MILAIVKDDGRIVCPTCDVPPVRDGISRHVGDCPSCGRMVVISEEVLNEAAKAARKESL